MCLRKRYSVAPAKVLHAMPAQCISTFAPIFPIFSTQTNQQKKKTCNKFFLSHRWHLPISAVEGCWSTAAGPMRADLLDPRVAPPGRDQASKMFAALLIVSSMVGKLVPLKGGIGSIFHPPEGKDYKWYISGIFPANWGIICYLPPFRGTRNNHW